MKGKVGNVVTLHRKLAKAKLRNAVRAANGRYVW